MTTYAADAVEGYKSELWVSDFHSLFRVANANSVAARKTWNQLTSVEIVRSANLRRDAIKEPHTDQVE